MIIERANTVALSTQQLLLSFETVAGSTFGKTEHGLGSNFLPRNLPGSMFRGSKCGHSELSQRGPLYSLLILTKTQHLPVQQDSPKIKVDAR